MQVGGQAVEGEIYIVDWADFSPDPCILLPSLQHRGIFPCTGLELVQRILQYGGHGCIRAHTQCSESKHSPINPQGQVCLSMLF